MGKPHERFRSKRCSCRLERYSENKFEETIGTFLEYMVCWRINLWRIWILFITWLGNSRKMASSSSKTTLDWHQVWNISYSTRISYWSSKLVPIPWTSTWLFNNPWWKHINFWLLYIRRKRVGCVQTHRDVCLPSLWWSNFIFIWLICFSLDSF